MASLTSSQRHTVAACYLGWMLDAFDFFILVFVLKDVAVDFSSDVKAVTLAITLTLAMRPVGALVFGIMADTWGRRPVLMGNVLAFSVLEFASGFAPSLNAFIALRALYGIAMGGEWGIGASLALESIPPEKRGLVSGILQTGYPSGYLLASLVFGFLFPFLGWRGMFMIGIAPGLLVMYIRRSVNESPTFVADARTAKPALLPELRKNAGLFLWAVVMMTCFNFLSHGTQDLYPTFLEQQRQLDHHTVSFIAVVYNLGAIAGGLTFGVLSNRVGRKKAIATAALLVLPTLPLWSHAKTNVGLALGAFFIQFFVQGAWGVVPAHLNELSPESMRGAFPGVVYQVGNLLASYNATLQAGIAKSRDGDYAFALALVAGVSAIVLALIVSFGREARGRRF
jgi:SHS family lactate transporter-like MFS transporter